MHHINKYLQHSSMTQRLRTKWWWVRVPLQSLTSIQFKFFILMFVSLSLKSSETFMGIFLVWELLTALTAEKTTSEHYGHGGCSGSRIVFPWYWNILCSFNFFSNICNFFFVDWALPERSKQNPFFHCELVKRVVNFRIFIRLFFKVFINGIKTKNMLSSLINRILWLCR